MGKQSVYILLFFLKFVKIMHLRLFFIRDNIFFED